MEQELWISVVVLLIGIFSSWLINAYYTRKTIERMEEGVRKTIERMEETMAKAIAPLSEVTASIKAELAEKKLQKRE